MPGTITHFWIFRETLRGLPAKGEIVGTLKSSNTALEHRLKEDTSTWRSKYKYSTYEKEGCMPASYGYLGATGPDLFYIPDDTWDALGNIDGNEFSDLMHYNRTGTLIIFALDKIKERLKKSRSKSDKHKLDNMLAYWIGHITHIAADVVIHPLVNTMAGAYHKNAPKQFEHSEGSNWINMWSIHNKVEHYEDSYVRTEFFETTAGLPSGDWEVLNFPRTACEHLDNKSNVFIVDALEAFYGYVAKSLYGITREKERGKLNYFYDTKVASHVSFRNYYVNIIPSRNRMETDKTTVVQPDTFNRLVNRAVALSKRMVSEAVSFLYDGKEYRNRDEQDAKDMYQEKVQTFELLRRNWNLDCGIGFEFRRLRRMSSFKAQGANLHVPLLMHLVARRML